MSSGYVLMRVDTLVNIGVGNPRWHTGTWKRRGRIKAGLIVNRAALFDAMLKWGDGLKINGWETEITQ
jgi:hypothetical protein